MPISSDYIKSLLEQEPDEKKQAVLRLALSCYPLLNEKTVKGLRELQEAMKAMATNSKERTEASGLGMLLERVEAQTNLIKK